MILRNRGLLFKQCLYLMCSFGLIGGCLYYAVRRQSVGMLKESLREQAIRITESTVREMDATFSESMRAAELLAARLGEKAHDQKELADILRSTLETIHRGRPQVLALAVACQPGAFGSDSERMILAQYDGDAVRILPGGDYADKFWYTGPRETGRGEWCEPFIGEFVKTPLAIYSQPFYETTENGEKKFAGVVCVDLSIAWLYDMMENLRIPEGGRAFLLSNSGRVVVHKNREWVFRETVFSVAGRFGDQTLRDIGNAMTHGKSGYAPYRNIIGGGEAMLCYMPMESTHWGVGIVFPSAQLFASAHKLEWTLLRIGIAGMTLVFLVAVWISIRVTRPLKEMVRLAGEIGNGNFSVNIPEAESHDEIGQLASAFLKMRDSLIEHIEHLKEVTSAKERMESELQVAQEIQNGILPKILPPFPKCPYFEINAYLRPARGVGGDLYDFFSIAPGRVCIAVGDVSGKGIPASLLMAVTQTLHRGLVPREPVDPARVAEQMNHALCENNERMMFVTYILAYFDLNTGEFTYCNAGHNPFAILRADGTVSLNRDKHGIPLGVRANAAYQSETLVLQPGDSVYLYTDGVTEAMNPAGELFGEERMLACLAQGGQQKLSPAELDRRMLDTLDRYASGAEQADDITMLALRFTAYEKGNRPS